MDGWMDGSVDGCGWCQSLRGVTPGPETRACIYPSLVRSRPTHPPTYLSIATLSKPFSMPPASSTSAPPASAASEARPITCRRPRELRGRRGAAREWRGAARGGGRGEGR